MVRVRPATLKASFLTGPQPAVRWAYTGDVGLELRTHGGCKFPGEGCGCGSREVRSGCRGGHIGTSPLPTDLQDTLGMDLINTGPREEGSTDVDGVD